jgi:hypothetical protein
MPQPELRNWLTRITEELAKHDADNPDSPAASYAVNLRCTPATSDSTTTWPLSRNSATRLSSHRSAPGRSHRSTSGAPPELLAEEILGSARRIGFILDDAGEGQPSAATAGWSSCWFLVRRFGLTATRGLQLTDDQPQNAAQLGGWKLVHQLTQLIAGVLAGHVPSVRGFVIFWEPPPQARVVGNRALPLSYAAQPGWRVELPEQLDRVLLGSCGRIQLFDPLAESPGQPAGLVGLPLIRLHDGRHTAASLG